MARSKSQQVLITAVIDKAYPLNETASAMRDPEAGHIRGKVVISLGE